MEAKLVKDLMEAYASVYAQPEEVIAESDCECEDEEKSEKETPEMNGKKKGKKEKEDEDEMKEGYISEDPVQDYRDMKRAKENAAGMRGPELSHSTKSTGGGSAKQKPQPRSREFSHGGSSQPRSREFAREEVETDLFDVILEYLVAEGYADTNQSALAIMANMSEEWKKSIVEQKKDDLEAPDYKDAKRIMNQGSGNKGSGYKGDKPGFDKITGMPVKGA